MPHDGTSHDAPQAPGQAARREDATTEWAPAGIDVSVWHSARVWNYWLGGKDNYPADREASAQVLSIMPEMIESARADRAFLVRAVRHLAEDVGIRQFLDIGTGLPSADNTHEVAQAVDPSCRVVYVDNDPIVLAHARALLAGSPEGATRYLDADVRDPGRILREAALTLDFTRPVALMLLGIINFVSDDDEAEAIVQELVKALPSGSHVALAHPTAEVRGEAMTEAVRIANETGATPMTLRSPAQIATLLDGLELLPPGIVSCPKWRPTPGVPEGPLVPQYCVVARKP